MKLVFIDPKCPKPYDSNVLATRGLGGTEATVVRIARALAARHDVYVLQHNRTELLEETASLHYLPFSELRGTVAGAEHVIFVQKAQDISTVARIAKGRMWLWLHNYLKDEVPFFWHDHLQHRLGIICVSRTHAEHTRRYVHQHPLFLLSAGLIGRGGITYLHNPIDDKLAPQPGIAKEKYKLVSFSSPHKGIEHVIAAFKRVYAANPAFRLFLADPGYIQNFDLSILDHPGITNVGSLPHSEVMKQVQESFCVFYPQYKRPETFGLVYAEANALGVPVLAHDFGAAREILGKGNPPIDARDIDQVVATLMGWERDGPPAVQAKPDFAIRKVASLWDSFLSGPDAFIRRQRNAPA